MKIFFGTWFSKLGPSVSNNIWSYYYASIIYQRKKIKAQLAINWVY